VIGLDIEAPEQLKAENFRFIKGDILTLETEWLLQEVGKADVVISDLAPKTTGISLVDTSRSLALAEKALEALTNIVQLSRDKNLRFGFNEWIRAQDGIPMGQDWQTWSAAMYLYAATCVEKESTLFFDDMREKTKQDKGHD